jgi:Subtilase family
MKKSNLLLKRKSCRVSHTGIFLSLILFLQVFVLTSVAQSTQQLLTARSRKTYYNSDTVKRWLDWNILFNERASDIDKDRYIHDLETQIDQTISTYNSSTGNHFKVDYHVVHCPCDPRLTNLNATKSLGASGSTVPPKPPGTGGSGDVVSLNMLIDHDPPLKEIKDSFNVIDKKVPLTIIAVDKLKILAVMDTGLDPDFFETGFKQLLWTDPLSKVTLRNFQFYHNKKPLDYSLDDDAHIHGTAVISIALREFEKAAGNDKPKPSIMVLKVLDEQGKGSTFSVSCGLSYAVQKQATLVNASLGYYSHGHTDPILLHYVRRCKNANPVPIPILAAAGNIPGPHNPLSLCNTGSTGNVLSKINTFDPASLSISIPDVISVTTIQNPTTPCFYQNYSNNFVDVGVANGSGGHCCKFIVPFLPFGYEGSSFATPFISGKIIAGLMEGLTLSQCRAKWQTATPPPGSVLTTKGGKFEPN